MSATSRCGKECYTKFEAIHVRYHSLGFIGQGNLETDHGDSDRALPRMTAIVQWGPYNRPHTHRYHKLDRWFVKMDHVDLRYCPTTFLTTDHFTNLSGQVMFARCTCACQVCHRNFAIIKWRDYFIKWMGMDRMQVSECVWFLLHLAVTHQPSATREIIYNGLSKRNHKV